MNLTEVMCTGFYWGLAVSLIFSMGIIATTKWHGKFSLDGVDGIQKFHVAPTPRIGGIAIFAGLTMALLFDNSLRALIAPLLIAGLPAFCFGMAEDLTKRISIRARLLATMASGTLAWALTGASITHTGIAGLDSLLNWAAVSVLFTAFAVGGVANSINIIDGFNGLASGVVVISLISLGLIAIECGDLELSRTCFTVCGVTIGFFLVNFPFGKLFLGDGGAYLLGFILAWLAVMLVHRNPTVSAWAALLACAYPIFETVFTIMRRVWAKSHPGQPDSDHLHSLIKIAIAGRFFPNWRANLRNSSVAPFSWSIAIPPAILGVKYANQTGALLIAGSASFVLYISVYWYVASASKVRRNSRIAKSRIGDVKNKSASASLQ